MHHGPLLSHYPVPPATYIPFLLKRVGAARKSLGAVFRSYSERRRQALMVSWNGSVIRSERLPSARSGAQSAGRATKRWR